ARPTAPPLATSSRKMRQRKSAARLRSAYRPPASTLVTSSKLTRRLATTALPVSAIMARPSRLNHGGCMSADRRWTSESDGEPEIQYCQYSSSQEPEATAYRTTSASASAAAPARIQSGIERDWGAGPSIAPCELANRV